MLKMITAQSKMRRSYDILCCSVILYFFYEISGINLNFMIFYDFMPSGTPENIGLSVFEITLKDYPVWNYSFPVLDNQVK